MKSILTFALHIIDESGEHYVKSNKDLEIKLLYDFANMSNIMKA